MDLHDDWHLDVWLRGIAGAAGVAIDEAPEFSPPTRTRTATHPGDVD